jgi:hypothetical protein
LLQGIPELRSIEKVHITITIRIARELMEAKGEVINLKRKMGAIIQPLSAGCSWAGGWRNRAAAFLAA